MIIDRTKEYVTHRLEQQNKDLNNTYSDHNVILTKTDFRTNEITQNNKY